ncbi:hypothetical protein ACQKIC_10570 [Peribacillus sp. NPDC046944]|uniref:hypothetical protein n=1 Tax=unclassified Peribacillus TaxID=2675266 RepID=UPI003817D133
MANQKVSGENDKGKKVSTIDKKEKENEVTRLNRLLGAVMRYLSDDEQEEIDIEYLLENTDGLREWWDQYRELDRKRVEEKIKSSLAELPVEELELILEQIRNKVNGG